MAEASSEHQWRATDDLWVGAEHLVDRLSFSFPYPQVCFSTYLRYVPPSPRRRDDSLTSPAGIHTRVSIFILGKPLYRATQRTINHATTREWTS